MASISWQQAEYRSTVGTVASSLVSVRVGWINLALRTGRVLGQFRLDISANPWVLNRWVLALDWVLAAELLFSRSSRFLYIIFGFGYDLDIFYQAVIIYYQPILFFIHKLLVFLQITQHIKLINSSHSIPFEVAISNSSVSSLLQNIMGNLYNTKTGILGMLEEHSNKQRTSANVDIPPRNSNQNQKKVSEPRNIKKDDFEIQHHRISPSSVGTQEILAKLHGLSIERVSFEQIWNRSQQILARSLKFTLMFPQPLNSQGEELLKNGSFFVYWLKILQKNPCVNMNMVYKNVRQRYQPNVTHEKSYLEQFLKQQQNIHQTPLKKTNSNDSTLKRSALKKSDKRVQFGKNQIIYPYLQQYKNLNISIQNKKQITRSQQAFLLDYFEINDIYLLEQVTIVGVLKEFDDTYAIVQVKLNKEPTKELTCIGITSKQNIKSHSLRILQEIQKQYQNLCFLELDGNSLKQL